MEEQRIVWQGIQEKKKVDDTMQELIKAGYNRKKATVLQFRHRIKQWGGPKQTVWGKRKGSAKPQPQQEYDFERWIELPPVIRTAFFPY